MSKIKTVFVCNECGYESAKWLGKCPSCGNWSTFVEEKVVKSTDSKSVQIRNVTPTLLKNVEKKETTRMKTNFEELDRVLGGGFVIGSLVLLGGEPGIREIYINFANM